MTTVGRPVRLAHAVAVAAVTVPAVALAHLLTSGSAPGPAPLALVTVAVALAAALLPGGGRLRTAVVVVLAQLAGHAVLAAVAGPAGGSGCLSVMGRGAQVGLRLAILREDGACPPGALALTPGAAATLTALAAGASVLALQALVGVLASALLVAGRRAWDVTRALLDGLAAVLALLVAPAAPVPVRVRTTRQWDDPPVLRHRWDAGVDARRGPPCGG